MNQNYIIEVRPQTWGKTIPAGIVVRDGHKYRFYSATHKFDSLDGQLFKGPREAEMAALRHISEAKSNGGFHKSSNNAVDR